MRTLSHCQIYRQNIVEILTTFTISNKIAILAIYDMKEYKKAVLIENDKEEKNIETLIEKLKDQLMSVHEDNEDMLDSSYDSGLDNVISVKFDKSKLH